MSRWLFRAARVSAVGLAAIALAFSPASDALAAKKKKKKKKKPIPWTAIAPAQGKAVLDVGLEANLSKDAFLAPVSIPVDYRYGLSKELSVGVIHSGYNSTGFYGGFGGGLCLNALGRTRDKRDFVDGRLTNPGTPPCNRFYDNMGLQAVYKPRVKKIGLGFVGGLYASSFGPFAADLKMGVRFRWQKKKLIFLSETNLHIAMSDTDNNASDFYLPLGLHIKASKRVVPFVQTGFYQSFGAFESFGIPLTGGVTVKPQPRWWVGGSLTYGDLTGTRLGPGPLQTRSLNGWLGFLF